MEPTEQNNYSVAEVQSDATSALPGLTLEQYNEHVVASGISFDVAKRYGIRGVTADEVQALGFKGEQARDGLLLPMYWDGETAVLHQLRPWVSRIGSNGKLIKYETPAGHAPVLARCPTGFANIHDPRYPIIITEGVKKLLAWETKTRRLGTTLLRLGESTIATPVVISLMGVRGWMGPNEFGGRGVPLAALREIPFHGANGKRQVILAFDSDVMTKPAVHAALRELRDYLSGRGADVLVMYLPSGADGAKVGLDDFLAAGHTLQDALNCCEADLRPLADDTRLLTFAELLSLPPLPWTIKGLLPSEGVTIFYGPFASYKSFVVFDWLACVASGVPDWFGSAIERHGPCVYIYSEGKGGLGQRGRGAHFVRRLQPDTPLLTFPGAVDITNPRAVAPFIERIRATLHEKTPAIVAIDTVSRNMAGDINKPVDMTAFIAGCDAIRRAFWCQVIAVHHPNKQGEMRGTLDLPNNADTVIRLERVTDLNARLTVEKQKDADHGPARMVLLRPELDSLVIAGVATGTVTADGRSKDELLDNEKKRLVFRALARAGRPLPYAEWLTASEVSKGTFSNAKALMEDRELVGQDSETKEYRLTGEGHRIADQAGWLEKPY